MNKHQSTVLNMSLLPLGIIVILILGIGYFLLQGDIKLPKFGGGPQIKRLEGFPTNIITTKELEKQRKVLKSEQELSEFLNSIDSESSLTIKDKINFDKEFVIAVISGTKDESGRTIKIRKVYEDKNDKTLIVNIEEGEMGEYCEVDKEKNIPIDIAVISKTDWEIKFEKVVKVKECEKQSTPSNTPENTTTEN